MAASITIVVPGRWHAFELARELHQRGALHRIVTTYPRSRTRRWGIPDDKVVSLPLALLLGKLAWKLGGEKWAMKFQFTINDLFARQAARHLGNPDLVHAWSGAAEPSLQVARSRQIPTVLERSSAHMTEQCRLLREEHAALGLRWEETPEDSVNRELREYALADCVFVPSRFVHRTFVERQFPRERLYLNCLGVDVGRFKPGQKNDAVFRVVFAGSLSVQKGIHHLVAAFRRADIARSELLLIGGATANTPQLLSGGDARIRAIGHVPQSELPGHYRQGSVFVLASVQEGFGMVLAQALACGLPFICSSSTGGEDILIQDGPGREIVPGVRQYSAGYVVPPGNPDALALVLGWLAADPARLAAMRRAAVGLAQRDLSWRRYAEANLAYYQQIIEAGPGRPAVAAASPTEAAAT